MKTFLLHLLLCNVEIVFGINVLILAFGPSKNLTRTIYDPLPLSLELLQFVFDNSKLASEANLTSIYDACTADFDWQDVSREILNQTKTDFIIHLGPLCEYAQNEIAAKEIAGYIREVSNPTSKRHLFATPALSVYFRTDTCGSHCDSLPSVIFLNSNVDLFADIVYRFMDDVLAPNTAFLTSGREKFGYMDKFCSHLAKGVVRRSRSLWKNFFLSFYYYGTRTESDWTKIWRHILRVTRYIVYCGDDLFVGWLNAGRKLTNELKDVAIFLVTINFESSGYNMEHSTKELLQGHLSNVSSIKNVKIINFRSITSCKEMSDFCEKFMKMANSLTTYPKTDSKLREMLFTNKLLFYTLNALKFFSNMTGNVENFWNQMSGQHSDDYFNWRKEVEILQLKRGSNGKLEVSPACVLKSGVESTSCRLYFEDKTPEKIPKECGFNECYPESDLELALIVYIVSGIVGVGLIIASISVCCYLTYRRKHEWMVAPLGDVQIKIEEIKRTESHLDDGALKFSKRAKVSDKFGQGQLIRLDPVSMEPMLGLYRSTPVTVHPFSLAKNRAQSVDEAVKQLRSLSLENVAQVHGYVVQNTPYVCGLVIEFGEHGILTTLLKLGELDLALKLPLLVDLCRALEHIHKSSLKYHGNLTSSCCVVDAHFVLKVQLTEFPTLKKLQPEKFSRVQATKGEQEYLWSAPEVIRKQTNVNLALADIYSFGIIAHEIVYQLGTFYVSTKELSAVYIPDVDGPLPKGSAEVAKLIVKILRNKSRRQIRPSFVVRAGEEAVMLILKQMIKSCWEEAPTQRCSLNKIKSCIRKVMHDVGIVNVFGSMVERLEFYSKHLQDAVQMKAAKVDEERRRIGHVLEQLFPGISAALIRGEKPKPVLYNNVCAYFNDLVGFTKICSFNKPATVVKFLNTLFLKYDGIIEMYNIHPVTRIGDAYMLVSGIPSPLSDKGHASEITQAALQLVEAVRTTAFDYVDKYKTMQIRTGIASGRAAGGIVGTEIPSYGICGDAIVVASKMESNSEPMKILVADSTYVLLKDSFDFESATKEVQINNSTVIAHWLKGMKNVSKIILDARLDGQPKPIRKFNDNETTFMFVNRTF